MKKLPCNSFKRFKFVFISPMKWKKCPVFILRVIFSCEAPLLRSHIWFPEFSVSCCMHCVLCCCRQIHVVVKQWKQNICHWRRQSTPNNWWFQFHLSDDEEPNAIETEIERAKTVEKNVHPVQRSTRFDDDDNDYYSNFTFHFVEIYDYAFLPCIRDSQCVCYVQYELRLLVFMSEHLYRTKRIKPAHNNTCAMWMDFFRSEHMTNCTL